MMGVDPDTLEVRPDPVFSPFPSLGFKRIILVLFGGQSAKFDKSILNATHPALVSFGELWDSGLGVESVCQLLVFFRRPRLAVIGGKNGRSAAVLRL